MKCLQLTDGHDCQYILVSRRQTTFSYETEFTQIFWMTHLLGDETHILKKENVTQKYKTHEEQTQQTFPNCFYLWLIE